MSYLSTTENVGFSGIPQNISDASCATQYKMAVEGVSGSCSEVNMFINDSSGDEQPYITHINDNYFHTKFKIDPNELYTFHDSDVIAGEITVSHTEDNYFTENADIKNKLLESPNKEVDLIGTLTNGEVKEEKNETVSNGHYPLVIQSLTKHQDVKTSANHVDSTDVNTKVVKAKNQAKVEVVRRSSVIESNSNADVLSEQSDAAVLANTKNSINSVNTNSTSSNSNSSVSKSGNETFLDVFKREQGLVETQTVIKTEPSELLALPPAKIPAPKKTPSAGKTPSQPKAKRGRGPALHEALQRIPPQRHAEPEPVKPWHAPGDELFELGPLDTKRPVLYRRESTSSDEDNFPDYGTGPVCVEEIAAESRGARLALRRAALRRQVMRADASMRLAKEFTEQKALAALVKKQLVGAGRWCRLPTRTANYLLELRGMPSVLTSQERRRLREVGWSGGESGSTETAIGTCAEERCVRPQLPCSQYCLMHVTLSPEQRLYASCAAVFAGGTRCRQPLLPLRDQTPLCAEHAWKRDNYDKLTRDNKQKKPPVVRKRAWAPPPRSPRRAKRRRRPPAKPRLNSNQSLSEMNACSNSSAYDSSEDTAMGSLSENGYIVSATNAHGLEVEVGHVPPDDILDPAVLSQIPDEAFTEFFNQTEGTAPFAESSELTAALEAVLDERVLDERALDSIADCVFTTQQVAKIHQVPASVSMQSSAPS